MTLSDDAPRPLAGGPPRDPAALPEPEPASGTTEPSDHRAAPSGTSDTSDQPGGLSDRSNISEPSEPSDHRAAPSGTSDTSDPSAPDLSVVILNWNTADLVVACLRALQQNPYHGDHEILVVDNASEDDSAARVAAGFPAVRLIRNAENLGYSAGNNVGLRAARGRFLLLLNSDTEVGPGALDRLVGFLQATPGVGAVTCRLVNPDGSLQASCMRFPTLTTALVFDTFLARLPFGRRHLDHYFMRDFDHAEAREVDQIPGTCTCLPREVLDRVGLLDETLWLFFNDVDLCKRIRDAGHAIHFLPDVEVLHHYGASTSRFVHFAVQWHLNRVAYYRKHFGAWSVLVTKPVALYVAVRQMIKFTFLGQAPAGTYRENMRFVWHGLRKVLGS